MSKNEYKRIKAPKQCRQSSSASKVAHIQIHTKEHPLPPNVRSLELKGFIALRSKVFSKEAVKICFIFFINKF